MNCHGEEEEEKPTKEVSCHKLIEMEPCKATNYRFPTMRLFPLFLDLPMDYKDLQLIPSVYMREMSYTTEERYKELCNMVRQVYTLPDFTLSKNFRATPCVLIFQNCINRVSSLVLSVTNVSKVSKNIKMSSDYHPSLCVKYKDKAERKLAAGMTVKFTVEYTLSPGSDHFHKIHFTSNDGETFIIPVIGLSERQILDLPDSIQLPITPVKVESKKTLIIRNISTCTAVANFICERPFKMEPDKIYLAPDEIATLTLSFYTTYLGNWKKKLSVHYETGEKVVISLEGTSELGNVYLSSSKIVIPDTFMGMKRQGKVSIHNGTDGVISFEWQLFKSVEEDNKVLNKFKSIYESYHEVEKKRVNKLVYFDVYDESIHKIICSRVSKDNIQFATSHELYFQHKNFDIFPLNGEIWPGGECHCTAVFTSEELGEISTTAYLEVGGLESRLPLQLSGTALGPGIRLNIDSIDVGDLHLMQVYSTQIIVENVGDIVGSICYMKTEPAFACTISCCPLYRKLMPGQAQAFLLSISRPSIGKFVEDVYFQIYESELNLHCIIKGNVITPPLKFSEPSIDFGEIALGFELIKSIRLINPSNMPFAFSMEVTGYWEGEAVRAWDKKPCPSYPRQLNIYPSHGFINPNQQIEIKFIGLLNKESSQQSVIVSVWDNKMDNLSLPVKYTISQLKVRSLTPEIFIDFAFLDYQYNREIEIVNDSNSTAFVSVYQEKQSETILCKIKETEFVMRPYDHRVINVGLFVFSVGRQRTTIMAKQFCSVQPILLCQVTMVGMLPVLNLEPMELDWGPVVLLVPTVRTFTILNVSPIPADYHVKVKGSQSIWKLEDADGVIGADSSKEIKITLTLPDGGPVEEMLIVRSIGGCLKLNMKATGVGSAIVLIPAICPSFDLGHLICSVVHEINILVMNRSSVTHELLWLTTDMLNNWTKTATDENQGHYFKIVPPRITLKSGEVEKIKITAYCEEEMEVEEMYYCLGVIAAMQSCLISDVRRTMGECLVSASFHNPRLKLSKTDLNFCVKVSPDDPFPQSRSETVTVTPDFHQEITLNMEVTSPFKLVNKDGILLESTSIKVRNAQSIEVTVMFDTLFRTDGYSWSADASLIFAYKDHPCKAILPLHGEVQYPHIVLSTHLIDFGGIHSHSQSYKEIIMRNMSPFDVNFSWEWACQTLELLPRQDSDIMLKSPEDNIKLADKSNICGNAQIIDTSSLSHLTGDMTERNDFTEEIIDSASEDETLYIPLMVKEALDMLIGDVGAPIPEDSQVPEEDKIVIKELSILLRSDELFERFLSVAMMKLPQPAGSPLSINDMYCHVVQCVKKLQRYVLKEEILDGFQDALIPFISQFMNRNMFDSALAVLPQALPKYQLNISKLIDLGPKWGVLLSGQEQVIGAVFKPKENIKFHALAICKILGGPTEKVSFKGICCNAKYSFAKNIDFGFIPFCEITTIVWKVRNECAINIMFRIIRKKRDVIHVEPSMGCINAYRDYTFNVMCLPLTIGPISTSFYIELATLEVVKVSLEGMAVMSQVLLELPENPSNLPLEISYMVIASLIHPAFSKSFRLEKEMVSNVNSIDSIASKTSLQQPSDMEFVQFDDDIPHLTDIKMAQERQIMSIYLSDQAERIKMHAFCKSLKSKYFNDCLSPGYEIDFGPVIIDSLVEKMVHVYNFGNLNALVSLSLAEDENSLAAHGLTFTWTGPCNISPGSVSAFFVTLNPKSNFYQGSFYKLKLNIVLKVCCGLVVPIELKAFIVQPELVVKNVLEFGEIKCSQAITLPLKLTNIGPVDSEWFVTERTVKRKVAEYSVAAASDGINSPFILDKFSGTVKPGEICIIYITFQPMTQGVYERMLEITIKDSRSCPKCKMRGSALEPYIILNQKQLDFGTVIPYFSIYEQDFSILNPCPFPVEISLVDYDSQEDMEIHILRAICDYYKTDRVHLPLKYYDSFLSPKLVDMYNSMAGLGATLRLYKEQKAQQIEEENIIRKMFKPSNLNVVKSAVSIKGGGRKVSSVKSSKRKGRGSGRKKSSVIENGVLPVCKPLDVDAYMANVTCDEKHQLVLEYMKWVHNIPDSDMDDMELMDLMKVRFEVLETLDKVEEERRRVAGLSLDSSFDMSKFKAHSSLFHHTSGGFDDGHYRKGTLIIFHGAPFTDYAFLANKAADDMSLTAVTLDSLIAEEAAYSFGPAAVFIRDAINTSYEQVLRTKAQRERRDRGELDSNPESGDEEESLKVNEAKDSEQSDELAFLTLSTNNKKKEEIIEPLEDIYMKIDTINNFIREEAQRRTDEATAKMLEVQAADAAKAAKRPKSELSKTDVTKSEKTRSDKGSERSVKDSNKLLMQKEHSAENHADTFLDIGIDAITELISYRLRMEIMEKGVVIDNLTGCFIKNAVRCLEMLLDIAGPIKHVYLINIHHSYEAMSEMRETKKYYEDLEKLRRTEEITRQLKADYLTLEDLDRAECLEAINHYHSVAVKKRQEVIMSLKHMEDYVTDILVQKSRDSKTGKKKNKGRKSGPNTDVKSTDNKTASEKDTPPSKKGKKKTSLKSEPTQEIYEIPPEEIALMNQFKNYHDELGRIICILEKYERLKSKWLYENRSKSSKAKRGGSALKSFSTAAIGNRYNTPPKEKENYQKDQFICSQGLVDTKNPHIGVPIIIISSARNMELNVLPHISALPHILKIKDIPAQDSNFPGFLSSVSDYMDHESDKYFWYNKPEMLTREPMCDLFSLSNEAPMEPTMRKETGILIKVKPQVSMPVMKEFEHVGAIIRRLTPLTQVPIQLGKKFPSQMFKKEESVGLKRDEASSKIISRQLVMTGSQVGWVVSFYPEKLGQFRQRLRLKISGWPRAVYSIDVIANIELPDIERNPESIFSKIFDESTDFVSKPSYVPSKDTFDFGFTFIQQAGANLNFVCTKFKFTNTSKLPVLALLSFNLGTHFELDMSVLNIKPGEAKRVTVCAKPQVEGLVQDLMYISIVNNPSPYVIQVCCIGVKSEVSVHPKELWFEQVMLRHNSTKTLLLTNHCGLPLFWKIKPIEHFSNFLTCNPVSGMLQTFAQELIHFVFNAVQPAIINGSVTLQVLDKGEEEKGELLQVISIPVKAESYDVIVNMLFPESSTALMDFGDIKVETEHTRTMLLENRSNYDIEFKIFMEEFPFQVSYSPIDIFSLNVAQGILVAQAKPLKVLVTVKCIEELKLENVPILKIRILNVLDSNHVVANLYAPVSLTSHFTKMKLTPKDEVGFGSVVVGESKVLYLTIENIGQFDFTYKIISKTELEDILALQEEETHSLYGRSLMSTHKDTIRKSLSIGTFNDQERFSRKSPDTRSIRKVQEKKIVGPFVVYNLNGIVKTQTFVKIKIACLPTEATNFNEVILIQATDLPDPIRYGVPVNLLASGCLPLVDFSDHSFMYREAELLSSQNLKDNVGRPRVVFSESTGLEFQNVIVSTQKEMKIYLKNTGMVSAVIKGWVEEGFEMVGLFSVSPSVLHISAYTDECFHLTFSPTSIQMVEAAFCMELGLSHGKTILEKVSLTGRGCLPIVDLISPIQIKSSVKSDKSLIEFGTCLLDFHLSNIFTFKNTGSCYASFMLELSSDMEKCFTLAALPHCEQLVKPLHDSKDCLICDLAPEEEAQFSCVFAPPNPIFYICTLDVIIVNNPYERYKVILSGRGFVDCVTIEGVPFMLEQHKLSASLTRSQRVTKGSSSSTYLLDFGKVYVDKALKEELKLRNYEDSWVRYVWDTGNQGINFYPRTGHIKPRGTMIIYAVFVPTKPANFTKFTIRCSVEKIIPMDICGVEWNSHEKVVAWLKHEDKELKRYKTYCNIGENEDEPGISESVRLNDLKIQVQFEADKPALSSNKTRISFAPTLICQGTWTKVSVKNTSRVDAVLKCSIVVTRAVPSEAEATPVFSSGLLFGNCLYPNTGDDVESTVSTSSQTPSCKSKTKLSMSSQRSGTPTTRAKEHLRICPFFVDPDFYTIKPGSTCDIEIKFLPMQMYSYNARLIYLLEGMDNDNCLSLDLEGTGLASYCHLEIEDTDYESDSGDCPKNGKAIITECIGLPSSHNKKFSVINPTDKDYHFEWRKLNEDKTKNKKGELLEHNCSTMSGLIRAHKSYEMEFKFYGTKEGKHENIWLLQIVELCMEQHIIFVYVLREPRVSLGCTIVNIKPTITGAVVTGEVSLHNEEKTEEIKYKIDKNSLFSEGRYEKLEIEPLCNMIPPMTTQMLRISFTPKKAGEVNFLVKIEISKKKEPFVLRVATCCYSVEAIVSCCLEGTNYQQVLTTDKKNMVNIGHMELRVPKRLEVNLRNTGKAGFYFEILKRDEHTWRKSHLNLEYKNKATFVEPGSRLSLNLTFLATCKTTFPSLPLTFKISKGPVYEVELSGDAAGPEYVFSFSKHDFGPKFIQTNNEPYNTVDLIFRNEDEVSLEVEKLYKDTDHLRIDLEHCAVPARSALTIVVKFLPRKCQEYYESVEFLVNGIYSNTVHFTGVGVQPKLELVKMKDKFIDFGTVLKCETVSRTVELANRSERSADITLFSKLTNATEHTLSIKPKHLILPVGKVAKITLSYTPLLRGTQLVDKIWMCCQDKEDVLLIIEGKGVGSEVRLDRDMIPFGMIVAGCSNTMKLALVNSGDFGARFHWDMSKASECFKITPMEGYSTPGSALTFDFTFSPKSTSMKFIRNQVFCIVENFKTPLSLLVTGGCSPAPPPKEIIKFTAPARQSVVKQISVYNDSSEKWVIYPTISGDSFSGEDAITVLPKQAEDYQVTFCPTAMAGKKNIHEGSVFFSFPDGDSMVYALRGTANPPDADPPVELTTPAKKKFIGQIPIKNWLAHRSQRFRVEIKPSSDNSKLLNKNLYKIYGNSQIEVAPNTTRLYDVHFFSYIPINLTFNVTYTDLSDGEFAWLDLNIIVTDPEMLEVYTLTTSVRKEATFEIPIFNPLDFKQTLTCDTGDFRIATSSPLIIQSKQTGNFKISYFPIAVESMKLVNLVVKSTSMGDFLYRLILTATEPPLPPVTNFKVPLGGAESLKLTLTNHTPRDASFRLNFETENLVGPKYTPVRALTSEDIYLTFEPSAEGKETVIITAESKDAGTFKFPVCLASLPPAPQGPFEIHTGKYIKLQFKNIFSDGKEFIMNCESDFFSVANPKRFLKSKQSTEFVVSMSKKEELDRKDAKWKDATITAKLVLSLSDQSSQICWLYYIKGIID